MTLSPMSFISDNTATVCPAVLAAITVANRRTAGYGSDDLTERLDAAFSAFFQTRVVVMPVVSGTAANAMILAALCPPWGAAVCHREAHIERDECGAPEFFTGGAKLVLAEGVAGKVTPESLGQALAPFQPIVHMAQPKALSLTQSTELGTVYRVEEIAALADVARSRGMATHMDGARFANALVHLGCSPADMTWRAGVQALSFGATKNGAMAAEAMIFFDPALAADIDYCRKRSGHLLSKMRYVSAQLLAYVETGVWRANAERANRLASKVAQTAGRRLLYPVEANAVFLQLHTGEADALRAAGFEFYDWGDVGSNQARFVISWDQEEAEVHALAKAIAELPDR
jgi:threonine aldolase